MSELNASLETSKQTTQANSTPVKAVTPEKGANNQQQPEPKKPASLAELFGNSEDATDLEINLDDNTPDDPNAPLDSIERLMKRHKLTPEQAYAIKIPMANGAEPLTIGQLKDKIQDLSNFEIEQVQFDERRIRQEGELLRSQNELRDILAMLPKEAITPKVLEAIHKRQDATTKRERQLTVEHIPSWRDDKKRDEEINAMQEMLADYGFDESFLHSVVDHRAMKFIRDTMLIRQRIRKSLENVRDPAGTRKNPSGKAAKPPVSPRANQTTRRTAPTQRDKIMEIFKE